MAVEVDAQARLVLAVFEQAVLASTAFAVVDPVLVETVIEAASAALVHQSTAACTFPKV